MSDVDRRRYGVWDNHLIGPSHTKDHERLLPVYHESAVRELVKALEQVAMFAQPISNLDPRFQKRVMANCNDLLVHYKKLKDAA